MLPLIDVYPFIETETQALRECTIREVWVKCHTFQKGPLSGYEKESPGEPATIVTERWEATQAGYLLWVALKTQRLDG